MDTSHPKIKVLIVEDSKIALKVASALIATYHCEIHSACLASEALTLLQSNHFDIIFMDIGLPDMNGMTLAHTIREMEGDERHTPIVALTVHNVDELRGNRALMDLDDYLIKPISLETIGKMLRKFGLLPLSVHESTK